ncbi:hypothetical protein SDENT7746_07495 [Streptococcus oralis subsp. dentisani]|uniref:Uncharacterized protein n=2 Tax=Streptococcus oralis TaxID=1303 RepID=A0A3R9K1D8_STROR|nr:hypothetical protein [Streptococcus oralis]QPT01728.1 hypothetical protein I6G42_09285 [Streptococcus oralis]RSJ68113.1 hypothetical protein D8805_05825 [Streptococcus oralis subsp. dentisani]CAK1609235.1 hypothetical protein SDENT7746_07495 [Streptococcus oralis subsp. dentisani]
MLKKADPLANQLQHQYQQAKALQHQYQQAKAPQRVLHLAQVNLTQQV